MGEAAETKESPTQEMGPDTERFKALEVRISFSGLLEVAKGMINTGLWSPPSVGLPLAHSLRLEALTDFLNENSVP
jgi:hypothetical protein